MDDVIEQIKTTATEQVKEAVARRPKRKYTRRRKYLKRGHRSADPALLTQDDGEVTFVFDRFAGLSDRSCCSACKEGHCIISGGFFCARPGLAMQPVDMVKPEVIARRKAAEKYLALKTTAARHNA